MCGYYGFSVASSVSGLKSLMRFLLIQKTCLLMRWIPLYLRSEQLASERLAWLTDLGSHRRDVGGGFCCPAKECWLQF